jgi:hypothetical protein
VAKKLLDRLEVHALLMQSGGAEVAKPVRREPPRPLRQMQSNGLRQPLPQRAITYPQTPACRQIAAFARQQRSIRVVPIVAELVAHLGQPPGDQPVDVVDRCNQSGLRATASAALAEAHMQLAVLAQVGTPVAQVEHHGLADA